MGPGDVPKDGGTVRLGELSKMDRSDMAMSLVLRGGKGVEQLAVLAKSSLE